MRITLVCLSNAISLQKYAANTARELLTRHSVTLITSRWFDKDFVHPDVHHLPVGATKTPRLDPALFNPLADAKLIRSARSSRPQILHFTSAHPLNLLIARLGPRVPKVFTIHDPIPHPNEPVSGFVQLYNKQVFGGLADRIILHGKSHFEELEKRNIDTGRCRYAPLGEVYGPEETPPFPAQPTLLFFGRIRPYKGVQDFLQALRLVISEVPNARAILAGAGDLTPYDELTDLPNLEIHNRFIEDEEEPRFFGEAHVVVLPYTSATQSGVIPIAYAYGRPVVATRVGSIPEIVKEGETGYLTPAGDVKAVAGRCIELLTQPNTCSYMGRRAHSFFCQNLTPVAMARHFDTIYGDLV